MRAPYVFLEGLSAVVYVDCESVKILSVALPASNGNLQPSILEVKICHIEYYFIHPNRNKTYLLLDRTVCSFQEQPFTKGCFGSKTGGRYYQSDLRLALEEPCFL